MNKKLFMMALCMVGHSGYAVESNKELSKYNDKLGKDWLNRFSKERETLKEMTKKLQEYDPTTNADVWQMLEDAEKMVEHAKKLWDELEKEFNEFYYAETKVNPSVAEDLDRRGTELYDTLRTDRKSLEAEIDNLMLDQDHQTMQQKLGFSKDATRDEVREEIQRIQGATYQLLGLSEDATRDEVMEAYHRYQEQSKEELGLPRDATEDEVMEAKQREMAVQLGLSKDATQAEVREAAQREMAVQMAVQYNKLWEDIQVEMNTLKGMTKQLQEYTPTPNADGLQMVKDAERMVERGKQLGARLLFAEDSIMRNKKYGKEGDETSVAENLARDRMGDDLIAIFEKNLKSLDAEIKRVRAAGDDVMMAIN